MAKNNLLKRLAAAMLSALLLCGTLSAVTAVAGSDNSSGYTLGTLTHDEVKMWHDSNLLTATDLGYYAPAGGFNAGFYYNYNLTASVAMARWIDGNSSDWNYGNGAAANGSVMGSGAAVVKSTSNEATFRIKFNLKANKEVGNFLISWAEAAPVKSYKIYAASGAIGNDALYSDEYLIASVENETEANCNRLITLDTAGSYQSIGIQFTAFSSAKNYKNGAWTGILLTELGIYGATVTPRNDIGESVSDSYISENYASSVQSIANFSSADCTVQSDPLILTDGKTDEAFKLTASKNAVARMTVELYDIYKIDSILIALSDSSLKAGYTVYMSDSEEGLFDSENRVVVHYYTEDDPNPALYKLEKSVSARFMGIQLNSTASDGDTYTVEIKELAAYGIKAPNAYTVKTNASDSTLNSDYVTAKHEKNLLSSGIISLAKTTSSAGYYLAYGSGGTYTRSLEMLADGETALDGYTHKEAGDTLRFDGNTAAAAVTPFRLQLDLGFFDYSVESILIYGLDGNEIGGYNIYVSQSTDDLFEDKNWIAFYKNTDASEVQEIVFNSAVSGKYIGFEVENKNLNASNPNNIFIKEIAVYGETDLSGMPKPVYSYTVYEDIVDEDYVAENHKYNLIRYTRSTNTLDDGSAHKSSKFSSYVTDGTVYDGSTHYTWYNTEEVFTPFRATYSLGQTVTVDRIMFASFYHSSINFSTIAYEIYISDTLDDLYSAENLAVYQNNYGKWRAGQTDNHTGASQVFEFTGNKPVGRYIGFRIISPNAGQDNTVRIEQLGVYSGGVLPVDPIYAQTLTDAATGVKVSVRKLEYEDEFKKVASLTVERFTPSSDVISAASSYYLTSLGEGYRIILKDSVGNVLNEQELEGRELEITIPYKYSGTGTAPYVCEIDGGELKRNTALFNGDSAVFITSSLNPIAFFADTFGHGFSGANNFKWDPVYELSLKALEEGGTTDTFDEVGDAAEEQTTDTKQTRKVKKVITKRIAVKSGGLKVPIWVWVIISVAVLAGATAVILIIIKRKKRNYDE